MRDLIPFALLLLVLAMPWRWPYLARGLHRHGLGWLFQTVCPCAVPKAKRRDEGEVLMQWVVQPILGLIDLITAAPLAVVLVSGVRARPLVRILRRADTRKEYDDDVQFNLAARGVVWGQLFLLLIDAVTAVPLVCVLLSGVRARKLFHKLRAEKITKDCTRPLPIEARPVECAWQWLRAAPTSLPHSPRSGLTSIERVSAAAVCPSRVPQPLSGC